MTDEQVYKGCINCINSYNCTVFAMEILESMRACQDEDYLE